MARSPSLSLLAAVLPLLAHFAASSPAPLPSFYRAGSQGSTPEFGVLGTHGAVATEVDVCSNIGLEALQRGGSAADAIISASLCVGSTAAFHSGIGGGGFALVRHPPSQGHKGPAEGEGERVVMLDFRETMPHKGYERMFVNNADKNASLIGGLAVGVPGELKAWKALHDRYGKLAWKDLFQPAIELNKRGFHVHDQLALALDAKAYPFLCQEKYWKEVYCPNGTVKGSGDVIVRKRYAKALQHVANGGIDEFYRGELGHGIVDTVKRSKGILTASDLEGYEPVWRSTNSITFGPGGRYRIFSGVAPCSGNAVLSTLQTVDADSTFDYGRNLTTHRLIEATKFAYGERSQYGDPAFVTNVSEVQRSYLSPQHVAYKRALITNNATHDIGYYDPTNSSILADSGTSQLTVVDSTGLTITLTTTINTYWGSRLMTRHGIILNNEMDDFSSPNSTNFFGLAPSAANLIRPGKRPLSSISPLIVEDTESGELILATGSAGGSRIITAVIQLAHNVLHYGLNLQDAIRQPRWHHQLSPNVASFEYDNPRIQNFTGFDNSTVAFLHGLGHNVSWVATGSSTPQGVQRFPNGTYLAASEVRQLSARGAAY
ncbi:hypothetical protein ACQY0O_000522 [Thecaphora frezii]